MAVSQSLAVTQSSQDVSGNTSRVRIVWKSTQTGESYNGYTKTAYYYVSINGGAETRYSVSYTLPKGSTKTLVDKTITVNHKANGTGTVKVRTWMDTGLSAGEIEQSKTLTLTTIPRATTPTLSKTSAAMGSSVTISLPRASSSFTHDLAYKFGSDTSWTAITTGAGSSYTWTVPNRASSIPNATSGKFTIRCVTKNGSTEVGRTSVTMTGTVPSTSVPTIKSVTVTEGTSGLAAQFGAFVQNKTTLKVSISASGVSGSTITKYSTTIVGTGPSYSKTYSGQSFTSEVFPSSGGYLLVKATDSRGRVSAQYRVNLAVLAYTPPTIPAFSVYRCDASGNADDNGIYAAVRYKYSAPSLGSNNTADMAIEYKRSADADYTSTLLSSTALSADTTAKPKTPTFSVDYGWDFRLTVTDYFGAEAVATASITTEEVILDIKANGKGIAFGKASETDGIDLTGWPLVGEAMAINPLYGHVQLPNGLLVQWGNVSITPKGVDEATTAVVTFPRPYASTPNVTATAVSSVPHTLDVAIQRSTDLVGDNKAAVAVTLVRSGTTTTGINWLAFGKGV